MSLAIYDLDETILKIDSDYAWTEFLYEKKIETDKKFYSRMLEFKNDYTAGKLNIHEYIAFCVKPITQFSLTEIKKLQIDFFKKKIKNFISNQALKSIKQHKEKGDFFLIITATNQVVTSIIAKRLQADNLIATQLEWANGHYQAKIKGIPCFQEGKVIRLKNWLKKNQQFTLKGSYFYSDSFNDLPLLKIVDNPVVVNGDKKLLEEAKKRNWPRLNF